MRSELTVCLPGFAGLGLLGGVGFLGGFGIGGLSGDPGEGAAVSGLWGEELNDAVCKFLNLLSAPYQRIQGLHDIITKSCSHLFFHDELVDQNSLDPIRKRYES